MIMIDFFTSQFGVSLVTAALVIGGLLTAVAYCIYFERKISAFIQDRRGPNRVGPWGLLQPLADGGKFLFKEDIIPGHVDKPLFVLAPAIIFVVAFIGFAAIPWGGNWSVNGKLVHIQVAQPDIGVLYIIGVASMAIYGVVLGGWASRNKYSFIGAMRATAQMISYEIPMGLCILVVVVTLGTLRLEDIVLGQIGATGMAKWNVLLHPVACLILYITMLAEANRAPFDMAEAEQELVGGYHTEYGALKFGMFFLAEYAHMITSSALMVVLFFGGWHLPWISWCQPEATGLIAVVAKVTVLCSKVAISIFVMMWIRWTLPRFRFDQIMRLCWKRLLPASLLLLMWSVGLLYFGKQQSFVWALGGNVALAVGALMFASMSKVEITGRQANMPAVEAGGSFRVAPVSNR